jgi:predicted RNA-binding Zn-ribbon protein involved in translation (DUF1610 family)
MKTRYVFNASRGSVLVTPYEYLLEARPGSLSLVRPSGIVHLIHLGMLLAVIFGYLGAFVLLVSSSLYQAARPWENPPLLWTTLGLFLVGFFVPLFATAKWAEGFAARSARRFSSRVDSVTLRGYSGGRIVQRVILQTSDSRILRLDVEATEKKFGAALRLAKVMIPPVPLSEEELSSIELARRQAVGTHLEPLGPHRANLAGFGIVAFFVALNLLCLWLLRSGEIVPGVVGFAMFVPLTAYMAWYVATRTGRFHCVLCGRATVFRRDGKVWTCVQCGNSWIGPSS